MKQKVICDTNVWYRLGQKGLLPDLKKYELYITSLSLYELISSHNISKKLDLVRSAFQSLDKYSWSEQGDARIRHIVVPNDAQILILSHKADYYDDLAFAQMQAIPELFEMFLKAKSIEDIHYDYKTVIQSREAILNEWLNTASNAIQKLRAHKITNIETIKTIVCDDVLGNHMLEYLQEHSPNTVITNLNFSNFDLFIDCFSLYLLHFVNTPNKVLKANDYIDFMNLLYCTDDYKYLTLELPTHNRIGKMLQLSKIFNNKYRLPDEELIRQKLNAQELNY